MRVIPPEWLDEVEARLLAAEAPAQFVPALAAKFGRHRRKVWGYVARVRARLTERARSRTPEADGEVVRAMLLDAFATAKAGGQSGPDARGMVQAARTYAEVAGVVGPRRVEISGPGGGALRVQAEAVVRVVQLPELEAAPGGGAVDAEPGPPDPVPGEPGE